jgi:hypothetical protein
MLRSKLLSAPTDFVTWKARAAAALKRKHSVNPGIIPARMWKHLYVQGHSPQRGAELAAVSADSARPARSRWRDPTASTMCWRAMNLLIARGAYHVAARCTLTS